MVDEYFANYLRITHEQNGKKVSYHMMDILIKPRWNGQTVDVDFMTYSLLSS